MGETLLADKEPLVHASDLEASKENVCLETSSEIEEPSSLDKRPSLNQSCSKVFDPTISNRASSSVLPIVTMASPITSIDENLSLDERLVAGKHATNVHSEASPKSVQVKKKFWGDDDVDDPASSGLDSTLMPCVMPQPITTYYTSLSADKLPVLEPVHTAVVCSAAAQRSVDILQKFWGDYTNDEHESSLAYPSAARNKKLKKQTNRQVSPKSTSSERIQTRSKKGVIKNNPKYCD